MLYCNVTNFCSNQLKVVPLHQNFKTHNMEEEITRDELKRKVDILFESVEEYRTSEYFQNLLDFCAHFKTLAPYNAMLVQFQMPKAEYVLTATEWRDRYHRGIKADARPLVVLFPFGPVNFVFEISQTYSLPGYKERADKDILNELAHPYQTQGEFDKLFFRNLKNNLIWHSISYNPQLFAGASLGAKIELIKRPYESIYLDVNSNIPPIEWKADYMISTNSVGEDGQTFASIVHELGHFFCHHLPAPEGWEKKKGERKEPAWQQRFCYPNEKNHRAMEFEAEVVSWLICNRLDLNTPSEKYLSYFVDDKIPEGVSIDHIFNAFNKIWDMCSMHKLPYTSGMLYTCNKIFEELIKTQIKRDKEQRRRRYGLQ